MDSVTNGFVGTIGNTPLIRLISLSEATGCNILGKAEHLNPGYSVKDRAAKYMLEEALKTGELKEGGLIVEATAGNTGIGLALIGNSKGCKCLFICPDKVSSEKIEGLRALGAEVEVVPTVPITNPNHFFAVAERRAEERKGYRPNQFENPNNMKAHYENTGPEIYQQTGGRIDAFVTSAGTGGTIGGISNYLKEKDSKVQVWSIESVGNGVKPILQEDGSILLVPKDPAVLSKEGSSSLEGIGSARLYYGLTKVLLDGSLRGDDKIATEMAHYLLKKEGIFVGPTAGLNVVGAVWLAKILGPGHTIVTILCDSGNNYKSKTFNNKWLEDSKIKIERTEASHFIEALDPSNILIQRPSIQ